MTSNNNSHWLLVLWLIITGTTALIGIPPALSPLENGGET